MAALVAALDNGTRRGENGHIEYGWSQEMTQKIVQFNFQLTRTDETGIEDMRNILTSMLVTLKQKINSSSVTDREIGFGHLSLLYRMIGHTRDIVDGKGEYALSYMMILVWYYHYPQLAEFALKCFVDIGSSHPYGSWKDIKYFCEYCKTYWTKTNPAITGDKITNHPLIKYAIGLLNKQIALDSSSATISLAAKWAPREKASFGWLYQALAVDYFKQYISTAQTDESKEKAIRKCKADYRKLMSDLNRRLDTVQIRQCNKTWSEIDFTRVTSVTLSKQNKAFMNLKKTGAPRYPGVEDRELCAEHFRDHIQKAVRGEINMKGARVGITDFVKRAQELCPELVYQSQTNRNPEIDLINSQWIDNSKLNGGLGKMIAMVDVSSSMEEGNGSPMRAAIGLGIRIAEKSELGKRVLTFSANPTWVNLEHCDGFVSLVNKVSLADWGANTNFFKALDLILDAIIVNKMSASEVQDMVLVILSDMNIDQADGECDDVFMYERIKIKYAEAGIRVNGVPYKPPHILFWNLRNTNGFPSLANQPNTSMMSGFSPALLNTFCEQGIASLEACTPISMMETFLGKARYDILAEKLSSELN